MYSAMGEGGKRDLCKCRPPHVKSWNRKTGPPHPRLSSGGERRGETTPASLGRRLSSNHILPPGLWPVKQAHNGLQLRYVQRGSSPAPQQARPQERRPRRLQHGRRRSRTLPGTVWFEECFEVGVHQQRPTILAQSA